MCVAKKNLFRMEGNIKHKIQDNDYLEHQLLSIL